MRRRSPCSLYASTAADQAVIGKAATGAILVAAVLFMPNGILGRRRGSGKSAQPPRAAAPVGGAVRRSRRATWRVTPTPAASAVRRPCGAAGETAAVDHGSAQGVQGRPRPRRRRPRRARGRDPRRARAQRLGQVDADQRRQRPLPRGRRKPAFRRHRARRPAGTPHRPRRHRAHLPDPAALRAAPGARQRGARPRCSAPPRSIVADADAAARSLARIHRPRRPGPLRARRAHAAPDASSSSSRAPSRPGRGC